MCSANTIREAFEEIGDIDNVRLSTEMGVGFASMIYLVGSDCDIQGQRERSEGAGA